MIEIKQPPIKTNKDGAPRKAGFELEYTGIGLPETAELLQKQFGGQVVERSKSAYAVENTPFGDFTVMLDMSMMQKLSAMVAEDARLNPANETIAAWAEKILQPVVSSWMPNEIVTPPLPLAEFGQLDHVLKILRDHGGKGTRASSVYAFGMHINPELPGIPPERLKDYIAAFILLQERLQVEVEMDITRQLTRFAKLFPENYAQFILQPGYDPDVGTLIDDYLRFNPTRNRALDMLPAFCTIDEARVRQVIHDDKVHGRPTFHYRLPNCDLDNPDWSPIREWNTWLMVEELAEDKPRLEAMSRAYTA